MACLQWEIHSRCEGVWTTGDGGGVGVVVVGDVVGGEVGDPLAGLANSSSSRKETWGLARRAMRAFGCQ